MDINSFSYSTNLAGKSVFFNQEGIRYVGYTGTAVYMFVD